MKGLDKYLTTDPNEAYYSYCESVAIETENIGMPWKEEWEEPLDYYTRILWYRQYSVKEAAAIVNRLFRMLERPKFAALFAGRGKGKGQ